MEKKNFIEFVERIENKGPVGKAFIQLLKTGWIVIKHLGLVFKSLYVLAITLLESLILFLLQNSIK